MFGFFKKKKNNLEKTYDVIADIYRPLLINKKQISNEKIIEIVKTVMDAFKQAADSKGEEISANYLVKVSSELLCVYDMMGQDFFLENLNYEIKKYLTDGLRLAYE